jgi:hypothetical protein
LLAQPKNIFTTGISNAEMTGRPIFSATRGAEAMDEAWSPVISRFVFILILADILTVTEINHNSCHLAAKGRESLGHWQSICPIFGKVDLRKNYESF